MMATAALLAEKFQFISLFLKKKDGMIFYGLIAFGTMASQRAYTGSVFQCPCSSGRNFLYSLTVIGAPAVVLLLVGIILTRRTWDLVSECRLRKCRRLSVVCVFVLLGTGNTAAVSPVTWVVISLMQGEAYKCALSEYVDPKTVEGFPSGQGSEVMAKLPCAVGVPAELQSFWPSIQGRLEYESQMIGWVLVLGMLLMAFLLLCVKRCTSPLGYYQEDYWSKYRSNEKALFERTACIHAHVLAAQNVKSFFGFVALDEEKKEELKEGQDAGPICSTNWNKIDGVDFYKEKIGCPLYSRLNQWASNSQENNTEGLENNKQPEKYH